MRRGGAAGCSRLSFASTVLLQAGAPAAIGISTVGGQLRLTWPADDLWAAILPDLTPNSWVNVTNATSETDDVASVTLPLTAPAQFFRLVKSPALPPPTGLTVLPEEDTAGDTWFAVLWDAVAQAVSYNLYYATNPAVNPDNYSSLPGAEAIFDITNNFEAVSNLVAGVTYYFVVTAVSDFGESAPSYPASGIFGAYAEVAGTVFALIPEGTNSALEEVPNVTITLSNLFQPQLSATTLSDANGDYDFPLQPAGTYQLSWSAPGFIGGTLPDLLEVTNSDFDEDLTITNNGSGLLFGQVTMADGSYAAQSDAFFGIQENVTVSLTLPGLAHPRSAAVDIHGNYLLAGLPLVNGATLSASNGVIGVSSNVNITGIVEADLVLPDTPPVREPLRRLQRCTRQPDPRGDGVAGDGGGHQRLRHHQRFGLHLVAGLQHHQLRLRRFAHRLVDPAQRGRLANDVCAGQRWGGGVATASAGIDRPRAVFYGEVMDPTRCLSSGPPSVLTGRRRPPTPTAALRS